MQTLILAAMVAASPVDVPEYRATLVACYLARLPGHPPMPQCLRYATEGECEARLEEMARAIPRMIPGPVMRLVPECVPAEPECVPF